MRLSAYNIRTIKMALWIIAGYVVISVLYSANLQVIRYTYALGQFDYTLNRYVDMPDSFVDSLSRSVPVGLAMGIVTAIFELLVLPLFVRRLSFLVSLLIRIAGYVIVTVPIVYYGIVLEEMFFRNLSYAAITGNPGFQVVVPRIVVLVTLISVVSAFFISSVRLVGRKFGQGVLLQYILGKYHSPREEERIFMFMDLQSSTSIAERLGHTHYHNFLNDLFHDISESILEYRGEVYQYVGDEIVISWPLAVGTQHARCIRCFFAISAALERKNASYMKKYGVEAKMKAGLHCGVVTTGEIGDIKTEIVYHGDAVNTTSRIQEMCNKLRTTLLVSGDLLHRCTLSDKFILEGGGTIKLRGKEKVIEVYSVTRKYGEGQ